MPRGGRRSTSFKPGVSGNPGGRPKKLATIEARKVEADVKALARECAPEAIASLKSIMMNEKAPPAARIGAATVILDRGYGRPAQAVEVAVAPWQLERLTDQQLDKLEELMVILEAPGPAALPAPTE
jgi:Family of unknown function (DUF5681)